MVLIRQQGIGGKRARTCNSRCYNAKHLACVCICHSVNHSVGLQKATENTAREAENILQEYGATSVKVLLV